MNADDKAGATGKSYPDGHGGEVYFPMGDISFADEVVSFKEGSKRPPDAKYYQQSSTLSIPNNASMSISCHGEIVLRFTDNVLIDIPGPDLYVFELGGAVEPTELQISEDGKNWINIGKISGARADVDIAGHIRPGAAFSYVKLTDLGTMCNYETPGADIDAVGAIGTALSMTLSGAVLFDTGKYNLKPEALKVLDAFAASLADMDIKALAVEGHTDNVGSREYNQTLSENRALSVRDYLATRPELRRIRLVARGFGEDRPLNDNSTADKRQLNRRVQFIASPNEDVGEGLADDAKPTAPATTAISSSQKTAPDTPANDTAAANNGFKLAQEIAASNPASLKAHLIEEDRLLDILTPHSQSMGGLPTVSAIARIKGAAQWANVAIKESLANFANSCQSGDADYNTVLPILDAQRAIAEGVPLGYKMIDAALTQIARLNRKGLGTDALNRYPAAIPAHSNRFASLGAFHDDMKAWHARADGKGKYFPAAQSIIKPSGRLGSAFAQYMLGLSGNAITDKRDADSLSFAIGFMADISLANMFNKTVGALKLVNEADACSINQTEQDALFKAIDNVALKGFWIPRQDKNRLYEKIIHGLPGKEPIVDFLLPDQY